MAWRHGGLEARWLDFCCFQNAPETSGKLLGASWRLLGASWRLLGASWTLRGASWLTFGSHLGDLGGCWMHLGSSCRALEASWKGLGRLLERFWEHFGNIWGVFWFYFGDWNASSTPFAEMPSFASIFMVIYAFRSNSLIISTKTCTLSSVKALYMEAL